MRRTPIVVVLALMGLAAALPADAGVAAADVFEQLKSLEGTWTGSAEGEGKEAEAEAEAVGEVRHVFEVSAAGTVVMETMGPDSDYEMINMYHLDGDDVVLTHYCAGGNQPRMRLDREASSPGELIFDFDGGTNLDPSADHYIHDARLRIAEDGALESAWNSYAGEEKAARMVFHLRRTDGE